MKYAKDKILSRESLSEKRKGELRGKKMVFTNGCFDILHPGHVDLLYRCRERGDALVVGLNTDASVQRIKGDLRPVNSEQDRAFVLAGLESVDYVVLFDEDTPRELIREIQPDVLIKGGDWPVKDIVGRRTVQNRGGDVFSLPLLEGYSTTGLIQKILKKNGQSR